MKFIVLYSLDKEDSSVYAPSLRVECYRVYLSLVLFQIDRYIKMVVIIAHYDKIRNPHNRNHRKTRLCSQIGVISFVSHLELHESRF